MQIPYLNIQIPFTKEHKKRTIPMLELWDNIASNFMQKDSSTTGVLRRKPFYMDLKGLYSDSDNVTYLYTIDGYPSEMEVSFRSSLRRECKEGVRLSFVTTMEKHEIQWDSPQIRAKLRTWKSLDSDTDEVDEYNLHSNLALLDSQSRRKASLVYLSSAEIRRKRKLFKVRGMLLVSGKRGENFDSTIKDVQNTCRNMGIRITRVMLNLEDYLSVFSPFSCAFKSNIINQVGSTVMTDELLARYNTYSQGKIGVRGTYWGTDIFSGFPCLKVVKRTTETAENWLITAETGGGKSFFVKGLLIQLLGSKIINGTIMDIEGFEYTPLAHYIARNADVEIINMAEGTGSYFDPVEIVLTGNKELDDGMYNLSSAYTVALFKTLAGSTSEDDWVDISITDAVSQTYAKAGVEIDDYSTWTKAEGLTIKDVYTRLKEQVPKNEEHKLSLDKALAKISRYFDPNNPLSKNFKHRVSVRQIADAKLVVCSFGMAGKTENSVDPIQMALMQLTASIISHLRSVFSKQAGKFNFKLWEEFQRWGKFPNSEKTIGTALTGGRKLGDINIIITNKVGELLDDDRFGIFQNITSLAVGAIGDKKVREDLCDRLSIENMLPELDKLVLENKDLSDYTDGDNFLSNIYSKAFLIGLDKSVYSLARMSIPKNIAESDLFRTGVDTQEENKLESVTENM